MIVHYKLTGTQSTSTTTAAAAAAATKPNPDKNADLGQCCPTPILHACMCFKLSNTHTLFTDHKHHSEVANYLRTLPNGEVTRLGLALGLTYPKLKNMLHCPDDMVDAWLRKEENVLEKSGRPTWTSLVKALRGIGQEGIAQDIEKVKIGTA